MPLRNPYISKRALEKARRIKELENKERKDGPVEPASVNVFKSTQKTTVAKSVNYTDLSPKSEVNNFEVNHPTVSKPSSMLEDSSEPRDVEKPKPVVNGQVRDDLIAPSVGHDGPDWHPVITQETSKKKKHK